MPEITNKGFKKPLRTESYDIDIVNYNTDKINELFKNQDDINKNLEDELEQKADIVTVDNIQLGTVQVGSAKNSDRLGNKLPSEYAQTNHASVGSTYGLGTTTNFGHVKLADDLNSVSNASNGVASTPYAIKQLNDKINTDVNGIFQTGDVRRSIRNLTPLGYINCFSNRTLPNASNINLSNKLAYIYGGGISNLIWRNNPITQTSNVSVINIFYQNGILFLVINQFSSNSVYYSANGGVTFTQMTLPSTLRIEYFNIKYLNGQYVMLSTANTGDLLPRIIYSSTNLSSWTQRYTIPTPSGNIQICDIDFINGRYIMSMSGNNTQSGFYYSTNLENWTLAYNGNAEWYANSNAYAIPKITAGNSIAITHWEKYNTLGTVSDDTYYTTTNGISWTKRTASGFKMATEQSFSRKINTIWCSGLGIFLSCKVRTIDNIGTLYSSDGISWYPCSRLDAPIYGTTNYMIGRDNWMYAADYFVNNMFYNETDNIVVVNTQKNIYISKDGKNFSFIKTPEKINNYSYVAKQIVPVSGKSFMSFMYVYSGENYTSAFGTADFPTCDYFYLPNDLFGDTWVKS